MQITGIFIILFQSLQEELNDRKETDQNDGPENKIKQVSFWLGWDRCLQIGREQENDQIQVTVRNLNPFCSIVPTPQISRRVTKVFHSQIVMAGQLIRASMRNGEAGEAV